MAKNQQLPLNPDEISGVCGRLLCCLSYEDAHYKEQSKKMPKLGAEVVTPQGAGRVRHVHPLKESVTVLLEVRSLPSLRVAELDFEQDGRRRQLLDLRRLHRQAPRQRRGRQQAIQGAEGAAGRARPGGRHGRAGSRRISATSAPGAQDSAGAPAGGDRAAARRSGGDGARRTVRRRNLHREAA